MAFLDKKEQVLDIQLTQHGKRLLSRGKLKPAYYAFFDDDIIYDSEYGGFTELRTDISPRIRNETPSTEAQYIYYGAETELKKAKELIRTNQAEEGDDILEPMTEKHYALSSPLGDSGLSEVNLPAWNLKVLVGEISSSARVMTGSHQENIKIPQINMKDIEYITEIVDEPGSEDPYELVEETAVFFSDVNNVSTRFKDDTYIKVNPSSLVFRLVEDNVPLRNDAFDIEMFTVEDDEDTGAEVLVLLNFKKKPVRIENNILLDQKTNTPKFNELPDSSYIEHFVNVYVDNEIDCEALYRMKGTSEKEFGFFADGLDCLEPEIQEEPLANDEVIDEDC